jgi:hypothetical protein
MSFTRFLRPNLIAMTPVRRRDERIRPTRRSTGAPNYKRIARVFYCDVLQGRQVWDSERAGGLSFIVEGTRIDVSTSAAGDREPVVLSVDNPDALAERCWDAGYSVRVEHDATRTTLSVIDPFGRQIDLVR